MRRLVSSIFLFSALVLTGCQTSMVKQFNQVKSGMDKDDVLELMGSPTRSQRFHGKDRWTYVFYDSQIKHQKEIQFFEGTAVYVGDTWEPPEEQSAYVIDQKNAAEDKLIAEQIVKEEAVMKAARKELSNYDSKEQTSEKVYYVPTFEGIK